MSEKNSRKDHLDEALNQRKGDKNLEYGERRDKQSYYSPQPIPSQEQSKPKPKPDNK